VAARLAHLGIRTVDDLCFHLPHRYQDRTERRAIGALAAGESAQVAGRIELADVTTARRRTLVARISDGSGALTLRWFHFGDWQLRQLARGKWLGCYAEVRKGGGGLEMVHPEYGVFDTEEEAAAPPTLTPFYPLTQGLTQRNLRNYITAALARHGGDLPELLPRAMRENLQLPALRDALQSIHAPPADSDVDALLDGSHPARRRLSLEELLAHHLTLKTLRRRRNSRRAPQLAGTATQKKLRDALHFTLTEAQQRVLAEVAADLARRTPALRLIQGDVGCGKTVVAALAAGAAVDGGYQTAVMAPTELLAEQHLAWFKQWFTPLAVGVEFLSGRLGAKKRAAALARIAAGAAQIVIGTHALFQQSVTFARLGLVVMDEQHRFGVGQRLALRDKGRAGGDIPHQLIMTATPIPRSLAMTFYADLDVSSIDQMPPGRKPVVTVAMPAGRRGEVVERVRAACAEGRQAYWVCPLIDESEKLEAQAAKETAQALSAALPGLRVDLVHGRMGGADKEKAMDKFRQGATQLLVATTVIEVGVDVPNAGLMIIENAERLGLSQLHQLRGRVGRGGESAPAACVLLYRPPLGATARARLDVLRNSGDGFKIAEEDLRQRGPGEVLGTRQAGAAAMRVADLVRDHALVPAVERAGRQLLAEQPQLAQALMARWVGGGERYGDV